MRKEAVKGIRITITSAFENVTVPTGISTHSLSCTTKKRKNLDSLRRDPFKQSNNVTKDSLRAKKTKFQFSLKTGFTLLIRDIQC